MVDIGSVPATGGAGEELRALREGEGWLEASGRETEVGRSTWAVGWGRGGAGEGVEGGGEGGGEEETRLDKWVVDGCS